MNDAFLVCCFEGFGDLQGYLEDLWAPCRLGGTYAGGTPNAA